MCMLCRIGRRGTFCYRERNTSHSSSTEMALYAYRVALSCQEVVISLISPLRTSTMETRELLIIQHTITTHLIMSPDTVETVCYEERKQVFESIETVYLVTLH